MRATRTIVVAAVVATAALSGPAVASGSCGGPHYQEVESLRIHVSEPVVRRGVAEVRVHVTRVGDPTRRGLEDADVAVGRVVAGKARFGRAITRDQGVAVVRLDRTSPSPNWLRRAAASKETLEADGCTPGVIETGVSTD